MHVAELLVDGLAAYGLAGAVFAVAFVTMGIQRVDSVAEHAPLGFRLIVLPGVAARSVGSPTVRAPLPSRRVESHRDERDRKDRASQTVSRETIDRRFGKLHVTPACRRWGSRCRHLCARIRCQMD